MSHSESVFLHLIGRAGIGKLTIARVIAARTGAKIIDNHYINDPVFNLIETDGTPLPDAVWDRADDIRRTVLETIATLSPADWSFVFTNVLFDDEPDSSMAILEGVRGAARRRGARFCPVLLECEVEENCRRIVAPDRRMKFKDISPGNARSAASRQLLRIGDPNLVELDVTNLSAERAADVILNNTLGQPHARGA